jgi:hypothetical protein
MVVEIVDGLELVKQEMPKDLFGLWNDTQNVQRFLLCFTCSKYFKKLFSFCEEMHKMKIKFDETL